MSWHGLEIQQWTKMWAHANWRQHTLLTLREIARDSRANARDRLAALQSINEAITAGVLPEDPTYPELMLEVLLHVVKGGTKVPFWSRRHQKRMRARLVGVRWMLQTAYQFLSAEKPGQAEATSFS